MAIQYEQLILTVSGTTASGTTTRPIVGELVAIHLAFSASMASTCDTTIKATTASGMPEETLLTITDSATSAWYRPRPVVHGVTGAALTFDGTRNQTGCFYLAGPISVAIAQGTAPETLTVTIVYEA